MSTSRSFCEGRVLCSASNSIYFLDKDLDVYSVSFLEIVRDGKDKYLHFAWNLRLRRPSCWIFFFLWAQRRSRPSKLDYWIGYLEHCEVLSSFWCGRKPFQLSMRCFVNRCCSMFSTCTIFLKFGLRIHPFGSLTHRTAFNCQRF